MNVTPYARIVKAVEMDLADANASIANFTATIAKDPHYAFRWAEDAMKAAAKHKLMLELQAAFAAMTGRGETEAQQLEHVRTELNRRIMHAARYPQRSTSVCANEMAAFDAEATASFLERNFS